MKKTQQIILLSAIFFVLSLNVSAQNLKNYFSIPEISLSNTVYKLAWSSHPNAIYYKHEYLSAGEKPESFKTMVMMEAITKDLPIEKVVGLKESELQERKKTDKVCNYQITTNSKTGEYMIDFLMSSGDIVEWNAYRYKKISDAKGNPTILLFALTKRGYGNDITNFLNGLKTNRIDWINLTWNYKLPTINLKD
ncbi:hypothetical protein [Flavobacterium gilvum]|uniref:Uncharacterized protein n=1 Tax=Flavobacterium gilvum TaxID=1492737 RepID=A0AAC9I785_9FLAO|nr:hypothetical protein [Flavobacterium gilvum]AOW10028.1 hypothetical protein EM308_11185 [Flavobacterium gilvum]KFC60433.1 hypothetical protein FEM08_08100 [Flavobacterium gilvum]